MKQDPKKRAARSPKTTPEQLAELATDFSTQRQVAKNPNTPKENLLLLAEKYPAEVMANPAFELFYLEDPGFLSGVSSTALCSLASSSSIPEWLLVLFEGFNEDLKQRLLYEDRNKQKLPARLLRSFARGANKYLQESIAGHPNTPSDVLLSLIESPSSGVVVTVVSNPNATIEVLRAAVKTKNFLAMRQVALHPNATEDVLKSMAQSTDPTIRISIAKRTKDPALLEELSYTTDTRIQSAVAGNPKTPFKVLQRFQKRR